jgi:hypothetical protein
MKTMGSKNSFVERRRELLLPLVRSTKQMQAVRQTAGISREESEP